MTTPGSLRNAGTHNQILREKGLKVNSIELGDFRWHVHAGGYELRKQHDSSELWVCEGYPATILSSRRSTEPARKTPALHRKFAELVTQGDDAILRFADEYGDLGIGESVEFEPGHGSWGEPLKRWRLEAFAMSVHIKTIEASRGGSLASLNHQIVLMGQFQEIAKLTNPAWGGYAASIGLLAPRTFTRKEPAVKHLRQMVALTIARQLDGHVYVYPAERKQTIEYRIRPGNLLGFLWATTALDFEGRSEARVCLNCGQEFFIASALGARGNRRFCSDACKTATYRKRKVEAVKLAAAGDTAEQIAEKLSVPGSLTSAEAVQRWIAKL